MHESVLKAIEQYFDGCIQYGELVNFAISKGYTQEEIDSEIKRQTGV